MVPEIYVCTLNAYLVLSEHNENSTVSYEKKVDDTSQHRYGILWRSFAEDFFLQ